MVIISNENNKALDYEFEILDYIMNNPRGVSITEIANKMNYSRNTVAKYTSLLEYKRLIFKKKIGPVNLLFSVEHNNLPSSLVVSFYKSLLKGLKTIYPQDMEKMKEIGKIVASEINLPMPSQYIEYLNSTKTITFSKFYMDLFRTLYTSFDILQPDVEITIVEEDYEKGTILFRFTNSVFLDGTDDFIYHLYFTSGIAEEIISTLMNMPIKVNVEKVHSDKKKEFSYYDLSIKAPQHIDLKNRE